MAKSKAYEPELVVPEDGGRPFYLSDDGYGTLIAWDQCHANTAGCGKPLMECGCKGGPKEPYYITRWRVEAEGGVWQPLRKAASTVGTSVAAALRKAREPEPTAKQPAPMSMSSFIDKDVIAAVKAAKEEKRGEETP